MSRRITFYVNRMDRAAKSGDDPMAYLAAQAARLAISDNLKTLIVQAYEQRLANRAKKAAAAAPKTCQICARAIQAATGLIAHHGYKRPGSGWQTSSCFGARWRPYEEAADALPVYIESLANGIESTRAGMAAMKATPPDEFTTHPDGFHMPAKIIPRPPEFTAAAALAARDWDVKRGSYAAIFRYRLGESERHLKVMAAEKERAEQRLAEWRAP